MSNHEITFAGDGTPHSATVEAQSWLETNGYSFGSSSVDGPAGVVKGTNIYIAKWRNMTKKERALMDGHLYTSRESPARLIINQSPVAPHQHPLGL
jgi:hypothetical protein